MVTTPSGVIGLRVLLCVGLEAAQELALVQIHHRVLLEMTALTWETVLKQQSATIQLVQIPKLANYNNALFTRHFNYEFSILGVKIPELKDIGSSMNRFEIFNWRKA